VSAVVDRYRAALESSDPAVLDAWAATGAEGVELLRRELRRPTIQPSASGHDREVLDHLTALIAAIAEAAPHPYLTAFLGEEWRHHGLVAVGYGRIDDPEATRRLVITLESDTWPTRVDAVMGLGRRPDPRATAALIEALDDPEYLVRYHAFRSLRAIGDETALRVLGRPAWPTAHEADLARAARDAIEGRRSAR
jgi:HEAT repeat protein